MALCIKLKLFFLISLTFLIAIDSNLVRKLNKEAQAQILHGDTIQFTNALYSFVIPKGWRHDWINNKAELTITPPHLSPPAEFIKITVRNLAPEEKNMSLADLINKQAKIIVSISPIPIKLKPVLGPQEISLDDFRAGKYVAEANPFGLLLYEGYIAAVKDEVENKILFLCGAYTKKKSNSIRPGLDFILNSIKKK